MFRCKHCGHVLTKEEIMNAHYNYPEQCSCPSCYMRGIEPFTTNMELTWGLKVLIDIAINFGMTMQLGSTPNYGNFDYYEELVKLTNQFLNTPAPEFDAKDEDTFYVVQVDNFADKELRKLFGRKENEV